MQFNEEASSTSEASFIHSSHQVQVSTSLRDTVVCILTSYTRPSTRFSPGDLHPPASTIRLSGMPETVWAPTGTETSPILVSSSFLDLLPLFRCPWRGHRVEDLRTHLDHQQCGPEPNRRQYEIYDSDLVAGWILDGDASVEIAADYALDFVRQRAWELQMTEEWENLWGH
ncbi:hypothetical protein BGW80DRAFT_1456061 [Lactifluus volemus]|nr:hypothetical protein BGW80DRAFT_1456061 [Lactifluus volemus]